MKKNIFLILVFCLFFLATGCQNRQRIVVLGEANSTLNSITDIKSEFIEKTGIDVVTLGFQFEESMEKANFDFANRTGRYDIVMQYNFSLSPFVRNRHVVDIQPFVNAHPNQEEMAELERSFFQNAWREVGFYFKDPSRQDDQYVKVGFPFASNTLIMVYNRSMFENRDNQIAFKERYGYELQPPTEWAQVHDVAEFFTNREKNTFGVSLQGAASWLYFEWALFAFGMGGGVMEKERGWQGNLDTPLLLASENTIKATELYLSLRPFNRGDFFNVDPTIQLNNIREGNVAFAFVWSDVLHTGFFDEATQTYDDRFGFTTIPGTKSPIAGGAFFINNDSRRIQESFDFIKWLLRKDNQIAMVKRGLSSPRRDVLASPEVQHIPFVGAIKESLDRGVYMFEAGPDAVVISSIITNWVQRAWRGEVTAREAMVNASNEVKVARENIFGNI